MSPTNAGTHAACGIRLSHVTLNVTDIPAWTAQLAQCGFLPAPATDTTHPTALTLRQGAAVIALVTTDTTGLDEVVDIALTVPDVTSAYEAAVARGARPLAQPAPAADGRQTAVLDGFGRTTHTLRQHTAAVHGQAQRIRPGRDWSASTTSPPACRPETSPPRPPSTRQCSDSPPSSKNTSRSPTRR